MLAGQLSSESIQRYYRLALALADEGGQVLTHFWGNLSDVRDKQIAGDLVTEADKESEKKILAFLRKEEPSHGILAEESGAHKSHESEFLWVIDPLDGTVNYAHQFPFFAVSIGLLYQGTPIVGVVYNPIHQEKFHGFLGGGAYLNNHKIFVSKVNSLNKSLLTTGFPYDRRETKENNYAEFCRLTDLTLGVRRPGAAALDLAYVACGRCDGYWERGIHPWDIAAGVLLVKEAGGKVSAYDGGDLDLFSGKILATNGLIHDKLGKELMACTSII